MKTQILKTNVGWSLTMRSNGKLISLHTFYKLVQAIEFASALAIHIDNIGELPLSQYTEQSNVY